MKLQPPLDEVFRKLFDHYLFRDEREGRQKQSGQSPFEAQMGALMNMRRHRPAFVFDGRGNFAVQGSDFGCGCTVHQSDGICDGGTKERMPFAVADQPQLARPNAVATALRACDELTRHLLELFALVHLPEHRIPFGKPLKYEEGDRNRLRAPSSGVAKEPSRGAGNLAHMTPYALDAWGLAAHRRVDEIGQRIWARGWSAATTTRIDARRLEQQDREHARRLQPEAAELGLGALWTLYDLMGGVHRLPGKVARAGVAA